MTKTRYGEQLVYPARGLDQFLSKGSDDAITELCIYLNKFELTDDDFVPPRFATIPNLLTKEGMHALENLVVPENEKVPEELLLAHPVAGPLALTMGYISLSNMDLRSKETEMAYSLKNETGNDLVLPEHRDLLDGHAVLYNYKVEGELLYVLDGQERELKNNELVVLHGAADWGDITEYLPGHEGDDPWDSFRHLGGVTMAHSVVGNGYTSRNRLLAYVSGQKTNVTQIPPNLPPWF